MIWQFGRLSVEVRHDVPRSRNTVVMPLSQTVQVVNSAQRSRGGASCTASRAVDVVAEQVNPEEVCDRKALHLRTLLPGSLCQETISLTCAQLYATRMTSAPSLPEARSSCCAHRP